MDKKYLKYKDKYIKLKYSQEGGAIFDNVVYGILLVLFGITIKRFNNCPLGEEGYRDPNTGILRWRGRNDIREEIKLLLDNPKIKYNPQFIELLKKDKITIGEIKHVLNKIKSKDLIHVVKSFFNSYGNLQTETQRSIDSIISTIDCGCSKNKVFTNNEIINPKCLEKPNKQLLDLKNIIQLNPNCKNYTINRKVSSFNDVSYNISFPQNEKCLQDELNKDNVTYLKSEDEYHKLKDENSLFNKIKNLSKLIL